MEVPHDGRFCHAVHPSDTHKAFSIFSFADVLVSDACGLGLAPAFLCDSKFERVLQGQGLICLSWRDPY